MTTGATVEIWRFGMTVGLAELWSLSDAHPLRQAHISNKDVLLPCCAIGTAAAAPWGTVDLLTGDPRSPHFTVPAHNAQIRVEVFPQLSFPCTDLTRQQRRRPACRGQEGFG